VLVIVVAGEVLVDLIVRADGVVDARLGGGPYNTARTLARLGAATTFFGGLADDRFGRQLRGALDAEGVVVGVPGPSAAPTTLALVDLDQAGVASYAFYLTGTAAADLDYPALATAFQAILADAAATADDTAPDDRARGTPGTGASVAVHVGALGLVMEPIGSAVERLLAADVPPDALVMLDPNCRPGAIADRPAYLARIGRIAARADVVKASVEDFAYLYPGSSAAEAAELLLAAGPTLVLVTDGPRPARAFLRGEAALIVEVPGVTVADTIGAGDAFGGGFLAWWSANGLTRADLRRSALVRAAVQAAAATAAATCGRPGADPPTLADLQARHQWPPLAGHPAHAPPRSASPPSSVS
jgi:fructokinase